MRSPRFIVTGVTLAIELVLTAEGRAQTRKTLLPSVSIATTHDDNVSAKAGGDSDLMIQVRPGLEARYESPRLILLSLYSFDMQRSARHPDLNAVQARRQVALDARVRPASTMTLGVGGRFDTTESPGDFLPATVVLIERRRAYRWQVAPSITQRVTPRTTVTAQYDLMKETLVESAEGVAGVVRAGVRRQWSARTVSNVSYLGRRFVNGTETYISHAALLGWTRQMTRRTSLTLQAGPRMASQGRVGPEVVAGLARSGRGLGFALAYSSTEMMVVGVPGPVEAQSATARLTWPVGRTLQFGTNVGVSDSVNLAQAHARVYGAAMEVGWSPNGPASRWPFSVGASYGVNYQTGELRIAREAEGQLFRRVFVVRLTTPLRPRQSTQPPEDESAASSRGVQR